MVSIVYPAFGFHQKQKPPLKLRRLCLKVRMEGLEPTHLTALDPKSSVSTNFTTSALKMVRKDKEILQRYNSLLFKNLRLQKNGNCTFAQKLHYAQF